MYSATKHGKTTYLKKHQLSSILEKIPISVVMLSVLHPEREGGGGGGHCWAASSLSHSNEN